MFFVTVDLAVAMLMKNTVQFAVRQSVRYAITQDKSCPHLNDCIRNVVRKNSFGFVDQMSGGRPLKRNDHDRIQESRRNHRDHVAHPQVTS